MSRAYAGFPHGFLYFLRNRAEYAAVIAALLQHSEPVTVAVVAQATGLPSAQVSGILRTCEYMGAVCHGRKVRKSRRWVNTYELPSEIRQGLNTMGGVCV